MTKSKTTSRLPGRNHPYGPLYGYLINVLSDNYVRNAEILRDDREERIIAMEKLTESLGLSKQGIRRWFANNRIPVGRYHSIRKLINPSKLNEADLLTFFVG